MNEDRKCRIDPFAILKKDGPIRIVPIWRTNFFNLARIDLSVVGNYNVNKFLYRHRYPPLVQIPRAHLPALVVKYVGPAAIAGDQFVGIVAFLAPKFIGPDPALLDDIAAFFFTFAAGHNFITPINK
jgi:hypothetical protein